MTTHILPNVNDARGTDAEIRALMSSAEMHAKHDISTTHTHGPKHVDCGKFLILYVFFYWKKYAFRAVTSGLDLDASKRAPENLDPKKRMLGLTPALVPKSQCLWYATTN